MAIQKKSVFLFYLASIILIAVSYAAHNPEIISPAEGVTFTFSDFLLLFAMKTLLFVLLILTSFLGLPFLLLPLIIWQIGAAGAESPLTPLSYYSMSFIPIALNLFVMFIVFMFTIYHVRMLFRFLKDRSEKENLKGLYISFSKRYLPIIFILIFISSIAEALVANMQYL
ncbi:hypothetical protein ACFPU1_08815 [Thalassorhabdus alkalitolerans]|uniref:Stage II sporulation protein M n=1 Tax=Thalassorhabdus alkalitolerans TaxID=2282697 RepID=A0ABW0YM97_9BACI